MCIRDRDSTGLPSPHVVLEFSDSGSKKFTEATEKLVGQATVSYTHLVSLCKK